MTFLEVFKKYRPNEELRTVLSHVTNIIKRPIYNEAHDLFRIEVNALFDRHVRAEDLYRVEEECRALYRESFPALESFRIFPQFPSESFRIEYIDEIAEEATRSGAVTRGFFSEAEATDDGETVTVSIPFEESGVDLVKQSQTEDILAAILCSRFGLKRKFVICRSADAAERARARQEEYDRLLAAYEAQASEQAAREIREENAPAASSTAAAAPERPAYPRAKA
ncbi:MAG: hypothetical protein ACI3XE_06720, partial [Eubacteriales bacterium]